MNDVFIPLSGLRSANLLTFFAHSLGTCFFCATSFMVIEWDVVEKRLNCKRHSKSLRTTKSESSEFSLRLTFAFLHTHLRALRWWSNISIKVTIIFFLFFTVSLARWNYTSFTFIKAIWLSNFTENHRLLSCCVEGKIYRNYRNFNTEMRKLFLVKNF